MTNGLPRRELLAAGSSAGLVALAGCSGLLGSDAIEGWPMFQRGPAHHGVHPTAEGPGDTLEERWTTTDDSLVEGLDADLDFADISPPVVSDGMVYVTLASPSQEFGASLVALDAADGSLQWQTTIRDNYVPTGGGPHPQPTVVDDIVVASLSGAAPGPAVVAVDAESGEVQWHSENRSTATPGTAWDGTVAFGFSTAYAFGSDGSLAWEFSEGEESPNVPVNEPPTITDDGVYVATLEGLYGLDHDGNREWTRELAFTTEPYSTPTTPTMPVAGDSLYVTTHPWRASGDGRLVALDPEDGTTQWEYKPSFDAARRERLMREFEGSERLLALSVGIFTPPALHDDTLYALGRTLPETDQPRSVPHLFAIDASTGEHQWETELPRYFTNAPPVIAGGTVYVAIEAGVVAIDAASGEQLASVEFEDLVFGLALDGDRLFVHRLNEIVALGP